MKNIKNLDDRVLFDQKCTQEIKTQALDTEFQDISYKWINKAASHNYSYHFKWLGVPIIQHPSDIIIMQELIFNIKPDLIIETGIARGGSLIFYSSMLELIWKDNKNKGKVVGIDIDIRDHNRKSILEHYCADRISLIEGSSIDKNTFNKVKEISKKYKNIMVILDSNHTHEHVLSELSIYSKLVTKNNYCIVFDTIIQHLDKELIKDRPWTKTRNPMSAINEFLLINNNFTIDKYYENKSMITVSPNGFLKRSR